MRLTHLGRSGCRPTILLCRSLVQFIGACTGVARHRHSKIARPPRGFERNTGSGDSELEPAGPAGGPVPPGAVDEAIGPGDEQVNVLGDP